MADPVYRILDANLNRAGEALRVVEDHCRFALQNGELSKQLKDMRHELGGLAASLDYRRLLRARDVDGDPGTTCTTVSERTREGPEAVLAANFRRLAEALRSLEETGKIVDPALAHRVESLRYRAYRIESDVENLSLRHALASASLMVILTRSQCKRTPAEVIDSAHATGARLFQLREKLADSRESDREMFARLSASMAELRAYSDVTVIINDRPDMALALGGHGVHLGRDDLPVDVARRMLGTAALIGCSVRNADEVHAASGADYVGAGAMFETATKANTSLGGPEWGRTATLLSALPVFCIGGIKTDNAPLLASAGVKRVAVGSGICGSMDPGAAVQELLRVFPPL